MVFAAHGDWLTLPTVLQDYHLNLGSHPDDLSHRSSSNEHADSSGQDASMAADAETVTDIADVDTSVPSPPPNPRPRRTMMQLDADGSESESPLSEPISMDSPRLT